MSLSVPIDLKSLSDQVFDRIVDAIAAHDADRAERLMRQHIANARRSFEASPASRPRRPGTIA